MNPIISSFLSMLSFGVTDFSAGVYARKAGTWSAIFLNEIFGLVFIGLIAILNPGVFLEILSYSTFDIVLLVFASLLNFLAIACLIHGFSVGNIGLVSALGSSFNAVVIILTWIFLGEGLTFVSTIFFVLLLIGVYISSIDFSASRNPFSKGAIWGLLAMVMWGISFFLMIFLSREISMFSLLLSNFGVGFVVTGFYFMVKRTKIEVNKSIWLIIISAVAEFLAYVFLYLGGSVEGSGGVVGAITGSYAIISVIFGYVFLKESLVKIQILGLVLIFVSIITISYYG